MKARINGVDVEGTPSEILDVIAQMVRVESQDVKQESIQEIVSIPNVKKKVFMNGRKWSFEDSKKVVDAYFNDKRNGNERFSRFTVKRLSKELGRSCQAISNHMSDINLGKEGHRLSDFIQTNKEKVRKSIVSNHYKHWSEEDKDYVVKMFEKHHDENNMVSNRIIREIANNLGRHKSGVEYQLSLLRKKNVSNESKHELEMGHSLPEPVRVRRLLSKENGLTPEDKARIALSKKVDISEWPFFLTVGDGFQDLLEQMVKSVIGRFGRLTRQGDGVAIGLGDVKDWNAFCSEFKERKEAVSRYFNVKNNFFIAPTGQGWIVSYMNGES